jgi:hypothetical protein
MTNPIFVFCAKRRMRSFRTSAVFTLYTLILLALSLSMSLSGIGRGYVTTQIMRSGIEGYIWLTFLQIFCWSRIPVPSRSYSES